MSNRTCPDCDAPLDVGFDYCNRHLGERSRVGGLEVLQARGLLDELQRELDWIETNSRPVIGEHGAWLESWANVRLTLARLGAVAGKRSRCEHPSIDLHSGLCVRCGEYLATGSTER